MINLFKKIFALFQKPPLSYIKDFAIYISLAINFYYVSEYQKGLDKLNELTIDAVAMYEKILNYIINNSQK